MTKIGEKRILWVLLVGAFRVADLAMAVKSTDDCTSYVKKLSKEDIFLNGRKLLAVELIKNGTTAGQFVKDMKDKAKPDQKYQCGFTRFVLISRTI